MNGFDNILDFMIIIVGIYLLIMGIMMKTSGTISDAIVWKKEINAMQCKDKEGMISYTFPRVLITALLIILSGALGVIDNYVPSLEIVTQFSTIPIILVLVWYCVFTKKAMERFY